jgi:hypothetical protein
VVVAITESHLPIFKALQARVADGHAKDVTSEIVKHFTTLASGFAIDHPVFFPDLPRHLR